MPKLHEIATLFLIGLAASGSAQNLKQCLKYAEENANKGDYFGAISFYEKALVYDSASIDILYKYALVLKDYNHYQKAAYYFEKVYTKGNGKIHPEAVYWLAIMQENLGLYREASKTWRKVKRILGRKRTSYYALKSKQAAISTRWARTTRRDTQNWQVSPAAINSYDAEFSPAFHDSQLYISSVKASDTSAGNIVNDAFYRIQIYRQSNDDLIALDTIINSPGSNNGEITFSEDGSRIYFTRCSDNKPCQIYISRRMGDKWSEPEALGVINVDGKSSVQPHITKIDDKEVLFFSSNRAGSLGGMDIWYSYVSVNGNNYSPPKNCGKQVNSPDDEISPFYDHNTKQLYFSSTWHNNYGGMDVFVSKGSPGKFSVPRNLGVPINSKANDMYFILKDSTTAYFTSNRVGSLSKPHETCCNDLFIAKYIEEPKDTLPYKTLEDLNRFLPVTLYFHNDRPNPNSLDTTTDLNYMDTYEKYIDLLPKYRREYSSGLTGDKADDAVADIEDFFFDYVDKGVEDLEIFTQLLLAELEKGQKIELTVQGYASPLAATEYNVKLTYRRISSMINYLKSYHDGVLEPYIDGTAENGGRLFFIQVPYGEYSAHDNVSDNPNDKKNSVYSRAAGLERKIEIQSVQTAKEDSVFAEIHFDQEIHDFGVFSEHLRLTHEFTLHNTGDGPLNIEYVDKPCTCIDLDYPKGSILPGDSATIRVEFPTVKFSGKTIIPIKVVTNAFPEVKYLRLTFEITE